MGIEIWELEYGNWKYKMKAMTLRVIQCDALDGDSFSLALDVTVHRQGGGVKSFQLL